MRRRQPAGRPARGLEYLFPAAAAAGGLFTLAILAFLLVFGFPLLVDGRLAGLLLSPWEPDRGLFGIYPMALASLLLALSALVIGVPLSLGTSCVISTLAGPGLRRFLMHGVRLMAAIPTVVYSFAALFLLVPLMRRLLGAGSGLGLLTAAPVLALLVSPTMIIFFTNSFNRVERQVLLAADALGATGPQKLLFVILPAAWPGILNGMLLGFGRAMGDTMVSLMLAGNSPVVPGSVVDPARTLTAHIALVMAADFDSMEFRSVFVCGLVLYAMTGLLMLCFRLVAALGRRTRHERPA